MMITLYSLPHSPYSTRCRIAIYHKGLDLEIQPPPGGLKSETYRALVPTKKVPALVTEQGILVESGAILEYLEDRFPETSLRASTAEGRAAQRALISFTDFSIGYPVAKADIHRGYSLTLQKLVIIIVIHIQNCKPFVLNLCNGMFQAGSWRVRFWLPVAVTTTLSSIRIPPQPLSLPISSRFRYDPNSPSSRGSSNEGIK